MMGWGTRISPEVRSLLEAEREVPALPASVRARAMARASAALSASPAVTVVPDATALPARRLRFAMAAGIVAASLTAIGAGAFALVKRFEPAPEPEVVHQMDAVVARATKGKVASAEAAEVRAPSSVSEESPSALHVHSGRARAFHVAVSHDEVVLLQRARAAVARKDFAGALPPLSAHARRFKDGRLAEEREALRVKALAGLGRTEDARETAAAFASRFPRSPLLPVVERVSGN